jgi:hypothetical protein
MKMRFLALYLSYFEFSRTKTIIPVLLSMFRSRLWKVVSSKEDELVLPNIEQVQNSPSLSPVTQMEMHARGKSSSFFSLVGLSR